MSEQHAVSATKQWLEEIIIGLNFCPFAKKEWLNNTIRYAVCQDKQFNKCLESFALELEYLANHQEMETTLFILPLGFELFESYLDLLDLANQLLFDMGYEGVFQIASFHPDYVFEGEAANDASNFTNRAPYPTIHIIREDSMSKVLAVYKNPEQIPDNNIELARRKGADYFISKLEQYLQK